MKKFLRRFAVLLTVLLALYYVGVNAMLASPLGEALFCSQPDLFQIRYDRAWTLIPGKVEVRGFQLSMQDPAVQLMITADRVHGDLHPWKLWRLHFHATDVEADGVTLRVRPRVEPGDPREKTLDQLPPIAGYESAILLPEEKNKPLGPLLLLDFENLTVHHLREVWIDRMRYTGDAEVSGGMLYKPFSRLRLDDVRISDAASKVLLEPNEIAIETLEARVALGEIDLAAPDLASLRKLTADLKLKATIEPRFLNGYLTNVKGLSTLHASGAPGPLAVDVKIDEGVVAEGALLSYRTPRVALRIPFAEIAGTATVKGSAEKGRLALDVRLSGATLKQSDGDRLAEAERFGIVGRSDVDLTKLDQVDGVLSLSGGRVKRLAALNQFIPEGAGVRITEGAGEAEGKLWLDASTARGRGNIEVTASAVTVQNRSANVTGRLKLHGEIRSLDLKSQALDLSGSTISIEDSTLRAQGRTWPLWVKAVADPCVLTPKGKVRWSTTITVGASNLQPLLAVVSANLPLPKALNLITNSPNVRAEATLTVREDGIDLPKLILNSQNLRAQGAMSLREVSKEDERLEPWGSALVSAGVFSAGVQLDGPKIKLVLFGLKRWAATRKLTTTPSAQPKPAN